MIIMKFGGSSLANAVRVKEVLDIVRNNLSMAPLLVVSAMGKTTDNLLLAGQNALHGVVDITSIKKLHYEIAQDLAVDTKEFDDLLSQLHMLLVGISMVKECSKKTKDHLVSFGERLSARIIAAYFIKEKLPAKSFAAWNVGFVSNSEFTNAEVLDETYGHIIEKLGHLKENYFYTPVITGYIAKDIEGNITTLGRGGSDLTAAVLGAALTVDEIQVWKDVDGILTTDPKIVATAVPIQLLSFEEASELAYFGAKILHPKSILPAMKNNIPVRVKNSYDPVHPGTLIVKERTERSGNSKNNHVHAITCKRNITLIDIVSLRMLGQYGFLSRVFKIFEEAKLSIDMIATSEVSISLTLDNGKDLTKVLREIEPFSTLVVKKNKTIISMICDIKHSSSILNQVFFVLAREQINVEMISQGASKVNIGFILDDSETEKCVKTLHKEFFESSVENTSETISERISEEHI